MPRFDPTTHDFAWVASWLAKQLEKSDRATKEIAALCHVTPQRLSQVQNPQTRKDLPSVELMWRLCSLFSEDEEYAAIDDPMIRNVMARLISAIGPRRLLYLSQLSGSDAQKLIDEHESDRSARRRLADLLPRPSDRPRKK